MEIRFFSIFSFVVARGFISVEEKKQTKKKPYLALQLAPPARPLSAPVSLCSSLLTTLMRPCTAPSAEAAGPRFAANASSSSMSTSTRLSVPKNDFSRRRFRAVQALASPASRASGSTTSRSSTGELGERLELLGRGEERGGEDGELSHHHQGDGAPHRLDL